MKTWHLNLYHEIFPYISNGQKTVEGRAWSKKRNYYEMKKGDEIIFTDIKNRKKITVVIDGVKHYKTVKDYLSKEGLKKCLPWAKSLREGIGAYYGIASDWEERIRTKGIFAIRIHL
jgi:ASC-1-like (ASCH) protein